MMTGTIDQRALPADVAVLARSLRQLTANGGRHLVGITGAPGAGKSTLAEALAAALGDQAALVGMDAFHLSNRQLERLGRRNRKGAPDTFDVAGYCALLTRLRTADHDVYAPVFDRGIEESIAAAAVIPAGTPIVLTEGNYLLLEDHGWAEVAPLLDTVWYLDVPAEVRTGRLERRRIGNGHEPGAAADWVATVDEPNARLVEATKARADRVVQAIVAPITEGAGE